jgi:hypothetical protein
MNKRISALLLTAVISSTVSAQSSFVVKDIDSESFKNQIWLASSSNISNQYTNVVVLDGFEEQAKSYFSSLNLEFEVNVTFSRVLENFSADILATKAASAPQKYMFNDTLLSSQISLSSQHNDVLFGMMGQRDKAKDVDVLIIDSGALPHEDVEFIGGFNYVEDTDDYTDITISDSGTCSSGHGLEMAGIIGASQNNSIGIAGIADVNLYMARALSTDCATGEDTGSMATVLAVLEDVASGSSLVPLPDVVNLSIAAKGLCSTFLQNSIDVLNSLGTTIVVSAGNQSSSSSEYSPANCQNVIVVGSHDRFGNMSSFSNEGQQLDVVAIGSRLTTTKNNQYEIVTGTSGAAAAVTGIVSVLKQSYPLITPSQMEFIIKTSSIPHPSDFVCSSLCGDGKVNLKDALAYADKIIDPVFTFSHAIEQETSSPLCLTTREVEALSSHMDICNALTAKIAVSYANSDLPVSYEVSLLRKPVGVSSWESDRVDEIKSVLPTDNKSVISILDVNADEYDYAVVACDEGTCPFVKELNISDIVYPDSCN